MRRVTRMAERADSVGGASSGALDEVRSAMVGLVNDPRALPRERVAAARVLVSACRLVRDFAELRAELSAPARDEDGA